MSLVPTSPRELSVLFRRGRSKYVRGLIETIYQERGAARILDLGGRQAYWEDIFGRDYLASRNVTVLLLNLPGEAGAVEPGDRLFTSLEGDALALGAEMVGRYDLVHANSVIEHVGDWDKVEHFAAVMSAAPRYYCQTPYFWFPIEPHYRLPFFHWLPESLRAKIFLATDLPNFPRAQNMNWAMVNARRIPLLDRAQMRALFPDGEICFEWLGLPKSIIAIRTTPPARQIARAA